MRLVCDTETDNLLDKATKLHSIVAIDVDTHSVYSYANQQGYPTLGAGLALLAQADTLYFHNAIGFDVPVLRKLYPEWKPKGKIRDTLLMSRLIYPDIGVEDKKHGDLIPKHLRGRYTIEAWGVRLGSLKAAYTGGFERWSKELQDYCVQDTNVAFKLLMKMLAKGYPDSVLDMEHQFCELMFLQEKQGFPFDKNKASALYGSLAEKRQNLEAELITLFPPWFIPGENFTPKLDNAKLGYTKDTPLCKVIYTEFNPSSRDHIASRLKHKYNWKPTEFTPTGKPKIDEKVIGRLRYPEAKPLATALALSKLIGTVAEGEKSWLKSERQGRIYGSIISAGAVTRRCTHFDPNIAQTPKPTKPYGHECRECFVTIPGFKLLGVDASGLELRCFAHYLAKYDGGAYGLEVINGDVHTLNMKAMGLTDRELAKTVIYAMLYGSGDRRLGEEILGETTAKGKKLKQNFFQALPAYAKLKTDVAKVVANRGYLLSIDGAPLKVRSPHSALNVLLQSAGAIAVKQATIIFYEDCLAEGLVWGRDFAIVAHIHDEWQTLVRDEIAEEAKQIAIDSMPKAGITLGFKLPLAAKCKIGNSWAETH